MDKEEIDFKSLFPDLITFLGPKRKECLLRKIKRGFNLFNYGPLITLEGTYYMDKLGRKVSICRIIQGSGNSEICLAEGEGSMLCDAEQQAAERLLDKLCNSCYVIKAKPQYFEEKTIALNADPSNSHIYKVVCLRSNSSGVPFPYIVRGAVDYVEDITELYAYINIHAKSNVRPDLFILNVGKLDRIRIRPVCKQNGLQIVMQLGYMEMASFAYFETSSLQILQDLLKNGGETLKFKLIGPRDKYGVKEEKIDKHPDGKGTKGAVQFQLSTEREIVIDPWIAENLVLMEIVTDWNELASAHVILLFSVKDCEKTKEFLISNTKNNEGMIHAKATIDKKLVGRARGFIKSQVKIEAAENALQNLLKHCNYIEAKKSYFGTSEISPSFLQQANPISETKIYRIADRNKGPPNKILQDFRATDLEDLYFLHNFTDEERSEIEILAKKMNFMVRWIGKENYLCVYKRRKPIEVLHELLLSTHSKENLKYKLYTPSHNTHQKSEGRATHENDQGISCTATTESVNRHKDSYFCPTTSYIQAEIHPINIVQESYSLRTTSDLQANIHPIKSVQESYNNSPMSETQVNASYSQSLYIDHGSASHSCMQGAEASAQGSNETPNWVMKFLELDPKNLQKPTEYKMSHSIEPPTPVDTVYSRNKFIPPKAVLSPVSTSTVNYQRTDQKPNQSFERNSVNTSKDLERGSTLSERLQQLLEEQNKSNKLDLTVRQHNKVLSNASIKTEPCDKGPDFKEEHRCTETIYKPTESSHSSQYNGSYERHNSKHNCSEGQMSKLSVRYSTGKSYDIPFTNSFGTEGSSRNMNTMCNTQSNTYQQTELFDRRPESTQINNSHWDQANKQHFESKPNTSSRSQFGFSNFFDYSNPRDVIPQGASRLISSATLPSQRRINNRLKGYNFSKIEKYGKNKRAGLPY